MAYKLVNFYKWCEHCEHKKKKENEDPCDLCLGETVNEDSTRPLYYSGPTPPDRSKNT